MPYQLVHEGVVREFEFYPPSGWAYWHQRARTEDGRQGLPLVIALHGGGQNVANFAADWPFPLLFNTSDNANWQDRCFVLYPYGFSYVPALDGSPMRGWSTGFSGAYLPVHDDVGFIQAMIAAVEQLLRRELDALGLAGPPIDRDRRYLFGYSMGGMLAYRLASAVPDTWAALWVMAAAYGGRSSDGLSQTVTHPPRGRSAVSLFAHHGDLDTLVPPGPDNDPSGLALSTDIHDLLVATGLTTAEADLHATSVRHLAAAALTYRTHNNCRSTAYQVLTGQDDVAGTASSTKYVFRQDGNPPNPEVVVYRDPTMAHGNFVASRYFRAADVWQFFKDHPRIGL